jgi:uncharacterized protein YbcI
MGNIARRLVQLQKEFSGKGPTKVRAHLNDDMVVVLLQDVFTTVEQTLASEGREDAVLQQRHAFQEVMNEKFIAVVEEETGRKISAFLSANHHDPDVSVEIFLFAPETNDSEASGSTESAA